MLLRKMSLSRGGGNLNERIMRNMSLKKRIGAAGRRGEAEQGRKSSLEVP